MEKVDERLRGTEGGGGGARGIKKKQGVRNKGLLGGRRAGRQGSAPEAGIFVRTGGGSGPATGGAGPRRGAATAGGRQPGRRARPTGGATRRGRAPGAARAPSPALPQGPAAHAPCPLPVLLNKEPGGSPYRSPRVGNKAAGPSLCSGAPRPAPRAPWPQGRYRGSRALGGSCFCLALAPLYCE